MLHLFGRDWFLRVPGEGWFYNCAMYVHPQRVLALHVHTRWWNPAGWFKRYHLWVVPAAQGEEKSVARWITNPDKELLLELHGVTTWVEAAAIIRRNEAKYDA